MKKNKRAIAIFSAYIPPHLGGIERYTDNLSKKLVKLGILPIIVTCNVDNLEEYEEDNGRIIIRLPILSIFKERYPIPRSRKLLKKLDEFNIKGIIINARFYITSQIGADYGYKHHIPVYSIEHGSNYVTLDNKFIDFFANRYEDFLTWRLKKRVNGFYGVSNACGEWLKNFGVEASGTWYNSIDTDQYVPIKEKHNGVNFLYAGRLIKQKGIENILDSFMRLLEEYDDISLYIAGDGSEFDSYCKKYHHEDIHFLGMLNYEELVSYYSLTDIFLYPPLWPEGLPTSILEAGLMKCAVIGTNQGGIKEIIHDGKNGLIVDSNCDSLYEGMKKLIDDKKLREKYTKELEKTIREEFSWDETAKKIVKDMGIS